MRDIKRRIASVKNMQQVTKAMEMVSAAKLRRAQTQATSSRPFAMKLREVLGRLVQSARAAGEQQQGLEHPLLQKGDSEGGRALYVAIAADRGLAGGYNANIMRRLGAVIDEETRSFDIIALGRKTVDYLRKREVKPVAQYVQLGDDVQFDFARNLARELMDHFTSGNYAEINLLYTEFGSAISHRPVIERLLPIEPPTDDAELDLDDPAAAGTAESDVALDYLYEPSPKAVLDILLPRYVETEVYRALMEAKASEHGARMTAMRSASDNASEMIDELTLSYNRARQASITKEISEIVGGAEALSGSV